MKTKRATWIPVVSGLIQKDGEVLIALRPEGKNLPGVWEFPGGKIEADEDPQDALARELKEELDIDAEIGPLKFSSSHQYNDINILLLFYSVKYWKGEPKTLHHPELRWIKISTLRDLDLPQANKKVIDKIIAAVQD